MAYDDDDDVVAGDDRIDDCDIAVVFTVPMWIVMRRTLVMLKIKTFMSMTAEKLCSVVLHSGAVPVAVVSSH